MREIAARLTAWDRAGTRFALATVVSMSGSAPRAPGATMAVSETGEVLGSVSGGCVEGTVYELCQEVLSTGAAMRESFGYSDDTAFAVGLSCGGTIEVCVQPQPPSAVLDAVADWTPVAVAQLLDGSGAILAVGPEQVRGSTGAAEVDAVIAAEARAMLDVAASGIRAVRCRPGTEVFIASYAPRPRLLVFGATDHAGAVASLGAFLGYEVTVCDARSVFATPARFPDADQVVVDWPHRFLARTPVDGRTVVVVLTHDAKFDVPLLEVALRLPVAYVGAMGSRRTHHERLGRLREAGLTERELARLRSPIGLDLGARTPEETAVAIGAEIVAVRRGGGGLPLRDADGPLHHDPYTPWGTHQPAGSKRVVNHGS
ncbi:XdhC family protein [Streptomyces sp. NBC_01373]|uniref:XdhC family protein n=1 Tax=Streptomyces sp. NBC_01373 TaxID=2903843 RepID=UPI002257EF49|nr:XdhC family protein [Streptomyces sp. NBC_01373]MCX4704297.1 XdhC family protein [Streptomyces sp. NBC_01373]